jgi:hypothetical protein
MRNCQLAAFKYNFGHLPISTKLIGGLIAIITTAACGLSLPTSVSNLPIMNGTLSKDPQINSHIVALSIFNPLTKIYSHCGGSLIKVQNKTNVLSAAHCFPQNRDGSLSITDSYIVFSDELTDRTSKKLRPIRPITSVRIPDFYRTLSDPITSIGDIAVVSFSGVLPDGFEPAVLTSELTPPGSVLLAVGWGLAKLDDRILQNRLHIGPLTIDKYFYLNSLFFAQSYSKTFPLEGDSGGPAFVRRDGNILVSGIFSWVDTLQGRIGAFTSVFFYRNWIETGKFNAAEQKKIQAIVGSNYELNSLDPFDLQTKLFCHVPIVAEYASKPQAQTTQTAAAATSIPSGQKKQHVSAQSPAVCDPASIDRSLKQLAKNSEYKDGWANKISEMKDKRIPGFVYRTKNRLFLKSLRRVTSTIDWDVTMLRPSTGNHYINFSPELVSWYKSNTSYTLEAIRFYLAHEIAHQVQPLMWKYSYLPIHENTHQNHAQTDCLGLALVKNAYSLKRIQTEKLYLEILRDIRSECEYYNGLAGFCEKDYQARLTGIKTYLGAK